MVVRGSHTTDSLFICGRWTCIYFIIILLLILI